MSSNVTDRFTFDSGAHYFDREYNHLGATLFSTARSNLYPNWEQGEYLSEPRKVIVAYQGDFEDVTGYSGWVRYELFSIEEIAQQKVNIERRYAAGKAFDPECQVRYGRILEAGVGQGLKETTDLLGTLISRAEAIIKQQEIRFKDSATLAAACEVERERLGLVDDSVSVSLGRVAHRLGAGGRRIVRWVDRALTAKASPTAP